MLWQNTAHVNLTLAISLLTTVNHVEWDERTEWGMCVYWERKAREIESDRVNTVRVQQLRTLARGKVSHMVEHGQESNLFDNVFFFFHTGTDSIIMLESRWAVLECLAYIVRWQSISPVVLFSRFMNSLRLVIVSHFCNSRRICGVKNLSTRQRTFHRSVIL